MKLEIKNQSLTYLASLYFSLALNLSLWRFILNYLEQSGGTTSLMFSLSLPLVLTAAFIIIFSLSLWPYVGKPFLILLTLLASVASNFMFQYGLFIDTEMVRNVFETDRREAFDLITPQILLWLATFWLAPSILLIKTRIIYQTPGKEVGHKLLTITGILLILGTIGTFFYKDYVFFARNNRQVARLINPSNTIYGLIRYIQQENQSKREFVLLDEKAKLSPAAMAHTRPTVFILVVGETARSMNFSLNGYDRETNPQMARQDLISFKDVTASGTSTAFALPAMFSSLARRDFKLAEAKYSENLLDVLQNLGYKVIWRNNNSGCKEVCNRVASENMVIKNLPNVCDGTYCYDDILFEGLTDILEAVTQDTVIVLHTMGSHGPSYYKRYPDEFKKFQPTCDTAEVQSCDQAAIVNTYDNTILYTDNVLAKIITTLKKFPDLDTGMLYVSDHGESLGENNIYLHGLPYSLAPDEQIKVPMIIWLSEAMRASENLDYDCLKSSSSQNFSHDYIFHSILGLMQIETKVYDPKLDLFKPCRTK